MAGSGNKRQRSPESASPPRRKRPGAGAAISKDSIEQARKRRRDQENMAAASIAARGVHDVVKQHYNSVPERGREWRRTDSKIKGLRSFNNWVKSSLVQKFTPDEADRSAGLRVLDMGCGKGGDLQKWAMAPQRVDLYVGADPANVSVEQASGRYQEMQRKQRNRRRLFHAEFVVKDCFGESIGDLDIVQEAGFVEPGPNNRWETGGFDVVTMMFCMHYAFEDEKKAHRMLKNVAGALKKGGRFIGVIPNSDIISEKVEEYHKKHSTTEGSRPAEDEDDDDWDPEKSMDVPRQEPAKDEKEKDKGEDKVTEDGVEWGNSIYSVKFPGKTPEDGVFRPPFGWRYFYTLEEAVGEVPEYVVPWEAFRALAEEYNLELSYRKPFNQVWDEEKDDPEMAQLSERMQVRARGGGRLLVSDEEMEAASFYHAFCFYKV